MNVKKLSFLCFYFWGLFPALSCETERDFEERLKTNIDLFAEQSCELPSPPFTTASHLETEKKRLHLGLKIIHALCPKETYPAFKAPQPLDNFPDFSFHIPDSKNDLLTLFLTKVSDDQNPVLKQELGRLCIVGFNREKEGRQLLLSCGSCGFRTLYFALRDIGKPHLIGPYLDFYQPGQSDTDDFFFRQSLIKLLKESPSDSNLLKKKIKELGFLHEKKKQTADPTSEETKATCLKKTEQKKGQVIDTQPNENR